MNGNSSSWTVHVLLWSRVSQDGSISAVSGLKEKLGLIDLGMPDLEVVGSKACGYSTSDLSSLSFEGDMGLVLGSVRAP